MADDETVLFMCALSYWTFVAKIESMKRTKFIWKTVINTTTCIVPIFWQLCLDLFAGMESLEYCVEKALLLHPSLLIKSLVGQLSQIILYTEQLYYSVNTYSYVNCQNNVNWRSRYLLLRRKVWMSVFNGNCRLFSWSISDSLMVYRKMWLKGIFDQTIWCYAISGTRRLFDI